MNNIEKDSNANAYKEVLEILKYMPRESVEKIPRTLLDTFERCCNSNWKFQVDTSKSFEEQNILEETKVLFAIIFRDYWATPEQRKAILKKEDYDRKRLRIKKYKEMMDDTNSDV